MNLNGDFKLETDAGETIFVSRNILNHVEKVVHARRRPAKFRQILRVEEAAPYWAEQYSYDKVDQTAEWVPTRDGAAEDFALATTKISNIASPLFEMTSGYRYRDLEMIRAQQMGMNLNATRAQSVYDKADSVLDNIAADGCWKDGKQLGKLKGLFNQAGVTPTTGLALNTTSWKNSILATSGDTRDAAIEAAIADILVLEDATVQNTYEQMPGDTLIMPLSLRGVMQVSPSRDSSNKLEDLIKKRSSFITRIIYAHWADKKAYGAGGSGGSTKRRIVLANCADPEGARYVLPLAPRSGKPVQTLNGAVHTPMAMVIGGFECKAPECMAYADMKDD